MKLVLGIFISIWLGALIFELLAIWVQNRPSRRIPLDTEWPWKRIAQQQKEQP